MTRDVLVVGGGLAGVVAAVTAAQAGAQVTLVSRSPGASALGPGGIDLVPSHPGAYHGRGLTGRPSLTENLTSLLRQEGSHTLTRLGATLAEFEQAVGLLRQHLLGAPLAWKGPDESPYLLATELGTVREQDLPPHACEGGDLVALPTMRIGIVGLPELPGFDPSYLAGALGERLEAEDRFVPLMPAALLGNGGPLHPVTVARLLEGEQGERLIDAVAELARGLDLTHLMLPPVFGLTGSPGLLARLRGATDLVPFEALAVHSPCPGLRLHHALHDMADAFGVQRLLGRVEAYELSPDERRVLSVRVGGSHAGEKGVLPLDELVLATGGLYGGGIVWEGEARESIFGLPVTAGPGFRRGSGVCGRRLSQSLVEEPELELAAFGAGLAVDEELRPVDGSSCGPLLFNLRACGGLLAGHDPGARRGGTGIALLSGWRAGRLAALGEPQPQPEPQPAPGPEQDRPDPPGLNAARIAGEDVP